MKNIIETHQVVVQDWGLINYQEAYQRQKEIVLEVIAQKRSRLILCEHPAVLTLGRMTKPENILISDETLQRLGIEKVIVDRGGDVTLHAPGQLIVYPIFDLNDFGRDLRVFLEKLENVVIDLLKEFAILASSAPTNTFLSIDSSNANEINGQKQNCRGTSIDGQRGVWVGRDKIVSMGIGVRKWVSYHGIGINVNTDLSLFSLIRPCGLSVAMTSMQNLKGTPVDVSLVKQKLLACFSRHFHLKFD